MRIYQKTLSRGKFLAKYYLVNFNVSKVNFFSWWGGGGGGGGGGSGRLFEAGHSLTFPT